MNVYIPGTGFATQGPCDDGFHVPMKSEWEGVKTIMDGLNLTTGDSWRINLHMPFAGHRDFDYSGRVLEQGQGGDYWSGDGTTSSGRVKLYPSVIEINNSIRGTGLSVRGFKNTFVLPDSSWTVIQGTLGSAGIFWDTTNGLISITGNGTTGYTIADKNLGATTVYSDGDTLSEANCGKYYQWGNNYGFDWTGSVTASNTQINASGYGPGNYYSSSTYIYGYNDWSSVTNDNLRGGEDGNVNITTMKILKNAYIGEPPLPPYLCFTANTAGSTVKLQKNGTPTAVTLETSTDGSNWTSYTIGDTITLANIGDKVYWRNTSTTDTNFTTAYNNYYRFVMTGSIAGSGDINYLLNKNSTTKLPIYCFRELFYGCSSLAKSPELPATTLGLECYYQMFYGCTSLITAPSLPATTLKNSCYHGMFRGCTSLVNAPSLPATTLDSYCYYDMFHGCTNLTSIPALPATTLYSDCYGTMFHTCSNIKLSTSKTGEYQTSYRIPTTGTGTTATDALLSTFYNTGGTFKGTPSINTTYYTSNTVV